MHNGRKMVVCLHCFCLLTDPLTTVIVNDSYIIIQVSWSLTSLFSTNKAMADKKVRGGELLLPSEGRPAIY